MLDDGVADLETLATTLPHVDEIDFIRDGGERRRGLAPAEDTAVFSGVWPGSSRVDDQVVRPTVLGPASRMVDEVESDPIAIRGLGKRNGGTELVVEGYKDIKN